METELTTQWAVTDEKPVERNITLLVKVSKMKKQ